MLLHGAEAVQRTVGDWRPVGCRGLPGIVQAVYAGVAAGVGGVLCVDGDAVLRRVYHSLPHRTDSRVPAGGADDGDLFQAGVQAGEFSTESGEAIQGTGAD